MLGLCLKMALVLCSNLQCRTDPTYTAADHAGLAKRGAEAKRGKTQQCYKGGQRRFEVCGDGQASVGPPDSACGGPRVGSARTNARFAVLCCLQKFAKSKGWEVGADSGKSVKYIAAIGARYIRHLSKHKKVRGV